MARGHHFRRIGATLAAAALVFGALACSDRRDEKSEPAQNTGSSTIEVSDAWARPSIAGGNTAIYMSINGGATDDQLLGIRSDGDLADSLEIHETVMADPDSADSDSPDSDSPDSGSPDSDSHMDDGHEGSGTTGTEHNSDPSGSPGAKMRTMRPVEAIDVPAGGKVELAPGGYHVMVMNLHDELTVGDTVPITLTFKNAGDVQVTAEVKEHGNVG